MRTVIPWDTIAAVDTADGRLELRQQRGKPSFVIAIAGRVLMTSSARRSEEALGRLGARPGRVLLGGLGMGYTLRALLDALPADARVEVAELTPAIVDWCRGPLAGLTGAAIADPRVEVRITDVAVPIGEARAAYDAIVLDLYEGPYAATQPREHPIFGDGALARAKRALRPGGLLAIWGEDEDPGFVRRLGRAGFEASLHRQGGGGRTHVIYLGRASR
jgi:spermidine synthase